MKTDLFTIIVCEIYHDPQDLLNTLVEYHLLGLKFQRNSLFVRYIKVI